MNLSAGELDRRIRLQEATQVQDAAGDLVDVSWGVPAGWPSDGKRWASKRDQRPFEQPGDATTRVTLRQIDTVFVLRWDRFSSTIAPETFRVVHHGRTYEIVGLGESNSREDGVTLLCCSRPDQRGSRAPESTSGES